MYSSKGIGEPPLSLAVSVACALREAVRATRSVFVIARPWKVRPFSNVRITNLQKVPWSEVHSATPADSPHCRKTALELSGGWLAGKGRGTSNTGMNLDFSLFSIYVCKTTMKCKTKVLQFI